MKKNPTLLYTAAVLIAAAIFCMCMNLTGSLLSDVMTAYNMDLSNAGIMSFAQYAGGIVGILVISYIADRIRKPVLLMIAYVIMAVALLLIGSHLTFPLFITMYLLLGAGLGMVDAVNNAVLCDLNKENRDAILSILHGVCGIGASFMPILSVIVGTGNWNMTYLITAGIVCVVIVLQLVSYLMKKSAIDACAIPARKHSEKLPYGKLFADKLVWISMVSMIGFGICQSGTLIWCVRYCKELFPELGALPWALSLSIYWIGTTLCRLLMGIVPSLKKLNSKSLIVWGGILGGVAELIGILSGTYILFLIGVFTMGALTGITIPRIVSMVTGWYPEMSGLVSCVSFIAIYIPYTVIPLLMGNIGAAWGMTVMMLVPVIGSLISGCFGILLPKEGR